MIKYALIDLDDTLLDFQRGEVEAIMTLLQEYGVADVKRGLAFYQKVNHETWAAIEKGGDREQLLNQRFATTFAHFDIQVDGTALNLRYLDMISNNFYLLPDTKPLLIELHQMGIKMIAATNGVKRNQIKRLKGSGIMDQFDDVWISEDVGVAKPAPAFFNKLFQAHHDMNRENVIMIGDGLNSDIQGANNANLTSIWFLNHASTFPKHVHPDYIVTNLRQIPRLIKKLNQ